MTVGLLSFGSGDPAFSKRSVINMDLTGSGLFDYCYIDHIKGGSQFGGPGQTAWKTGTIWGQQIDANGWPIYSSTTRTAPLGGFALPASTDFAGPYTIDGQGSGRLQIPQTGTWTLGAATGVTNVSNGVWDVVDSGSGWTAQLTYSGARQTVGLNATRNDPSSTGSFLKNVRFYRTADAADLAAGKVFRTPWKQSLVDLNPSIIRVMNWTGQNNAKNCRFENRTKPGYAQWTPSNFNWVASPPYGETTGTNQYALAGVTGTPVAQTHGELATCRLGNTAARVGSVTVSAITKANPGAVTATAHGFNTGDQIVHIISAGMTQLDHFPVTITVSDADHYTIGIDTSAFTTFTAGVAEQFITLNVAARGAYPVIFPDGTTTAGHYGTGYLTTGDYKTFYFDKTMSGQKDSGGNWILGAWIFNDLGSDRGHAGGTPLEVCVALVNELAVLNTRGPIHLWVTIPHWGMLSMDADYNAASNFATNTVDVCLNGANGYAGLNAASKLFIEYSNETWNSGGSAFSQTPYLARRGFLHWPATGTTDYASMVGLRSFVMAQDILAAGFNRSRFRLVLAGQGTLGIAGGSMNYLRVNGSASMLADALNPGGASPMSLHDAFAWAGYFAASSAFDTANLATLTAAWLSHAGNTAAQEADCAAYVVGIVGSGSGETTSRYGDTLLPAYAAAMVALGKRTIMYEGGWDRSVTNGADGNQNAFLVAVKKSQTWADALVAFHNKFNTVAGAFAPADYIQLNDRWGHLSPDSYASNVAGVEWSGLDLPWQGIATRNHSA